MESAGVSSQLRYNRLIKDWVGVSTASRLDESSSFNLFSNCLRDEKKLECGEGL
uniref:Uncharacterized protein n=1 Tax=Solanum lycopersicum TaxID=4081 RepID=A0A3Q7F275_SOLLC